MTLAPLILAATVSGLQCGVTPDVYAGLAELGQSRQYIAMPAPDQLVEFWGGGDGWTMFVTTPDGISCLISEGIMWQEFDEKGKPQI